jgi:hypothetical protein
MGNVLASGKQMAILQDMMERMSMRGLARTKAGNTGASGRVSRTTVHKLLADAVTRPSSFWMPACATCPRA